MKIGHKNEFWSTFSYLQIFVCISDYLLKRALEVESVLIGILSATSDRNPFQINFKNSKGTLSVEVWQVGRQLEALLNPGLKLKTSGFCFSVFLHLLVLFPVIGYFLWLVGFLTVMEKMVQFKSFQLKILSKKSRG